MKGGKCNRKKLHKNENVKGKAGSGKCLGHLHARPSRGHALFILPGDT